MDAKEILESALKNIEEEISSISLGAGFKHIRKRKGELVFARIGSSVECYLHYVRMPQNRLFTPESGFKTDLTRVEFDLFGYVTSVELRGLANMPEDKDPLPHGHARIGAAGFCGDERYGSGRFVLHETELASHGYIAKCTSELMRFILDIRDAKTLIATLAKQPAFINNFASTMWSACAYLELIDKDEIPLASHLKNIGRADNEVHLSFKKLVDATKG